MTTPGPSPASTRHPDDHRDPFTRSRDTKALNRDFLAAISVGAPVIVRDYLDGIAGRLDAAGWGETTEGEVRHGA